jgi:hypothetical protein
MDLRPLPQTGQQISRRKRGGSKTTVLMARQCVSPKSAQRFWGNDRHKQIAPEPRISGHGNSSGSVE